MPIEADRTQTFEALRPRLVGLAYRMLGSVSEAEDVVQEAYLRWHDAEGVADPTRWLVTVTTRLAVDQLRKASRRREEYKGPWLPEPVATDRPTPFDRAELADHLSMAFLALLERLSPPERAAFLLREVFDYDYAVIAGMLDKSEVACRQMVSRSRRSLQRDRPRYTADPEAHRHLAETFVVAARSGNLAPLEGLLERDVVLYTDGGGKVLAALNPIFGAEKVVRFFLGILPKLPPGAEFAVREVNGEPTVVLTVDGQIDQTLGFELENGRVRAFYAVRNPDKLGWIN